MSSRRRNGFILLLVAGLLAISLYVIAREPTKLGLDLKGGVELVYQGKPTPQQKEITADAIDRALEIMRKRVDRLGVSEPEIQRSGKDQISVGLPDVQNAQRAIETVGTTAQLFFYDWEKNLIGENGKPVPAGSELPSPTSLYEAVKLASKRPAVKSGKNTTNGQYYLFSKSRKLLAGPEEFRAELFDEQPGGKQPQGSEILFVKPGTVVVRATFEKPEKFSERKEFDRFYVLNDSPALSGTEIKDPKQQFDEGPGGTGEPIVAFDFTSKGRDAWQKVTREISQRGAGLQSSQHFGIVLDDEAITVPQIEFRKFPDGLDGVGGSSIIGSFTIESAQDLANLLRIGALPIKLELISQSQVSATLGKQALDQGLLAGAGGVIAVALFLLIFYRVLGVIAVVALGVYGIYFFALIKLIPITLTLPGIAGLVLTVGVAADANIVIFERVKEEIRAGRSVVAGIAAGYKKGFSTIVDANIVTLMTAFVLFVLATSGVKGFAFTLGVGTIVSLFTAVLATSAILGTMGNTGLLRHKWALGAGEAKARWRFDFNGASKWFFSMSGLILLVGSLAVGAFGLNFGIDFESGTRIKTALERPATEDQVRDVLSGTGYADAKIQKVSDPDLGRNVFQISTSTLQPAKVQQVKKSLDARFGVGNNFSNESIGPTFGQTVAKSALIAIIVSLLLISIYITLRFEWKFAVPVLIALMHDLLITGGVYALTEREVTTSTVAALLTILGFSLYDTIIVFDRIRENMPRMPRAAFSQIVNRSMSEVLTRSLATSFCTLLPVLALLLFGGDTLKDFAFALLVGIASGTYSSIFIASPVLTHWKEREPTYARRAARIRSENNGVVPPFAPLSGDAAPSEKNTESRRITEPESEQVSQSEFRQMVSELGVEEPPLLAERPESTPPETGAEPSEPKPKREKKKRPRNRKHGRRR